MAPQRSTAPAEATRAILPGHLAANGAAAGHLDGALEMMGARMKFARHAEIFSEEEPTEYLYKVLSGTVRSSKLFSDGRRQISGFHFAGDYFGLETGEEHQFSAEAITDCIILVVKRSAVEALAARDSQIARELWNLAARDLQTAREHMLSLGRRNAQERLVTFLLDMARRSRVPNEVELPMSRQDIADYLGLTIETVSRTLTQLEAASAITLPSSRRVVLRDRASLSELNG